MSHSVQTVRLKVSWISCVLLMCLCFTLNLVSGFMNFRTRLLLGHAGQVNSSRLTTSSLYVTSTSESDTLQYGFEGRRRIIEKLASATFGISASLLVKSDLCSVAAETDGMSWQQFEQAGKGYRYSLRVPADFVQGGKPVKTHLSEVNFDSSSIKGYQVGVTVDPVRINSITEFGTPNEVAARVVTAELNRDGILEVTVGQDPSQVTNESGIVSYLLDYVSDGKRGRKHFYTKTTIHEGELYVLSAQIKTADETPFLSRQIKEILHSFNVVQF